MILTLRLKYYRGLGYTCSLADSLCYCSLRNYSTIAYVADSTTVIFNIL